MKTRILMLLTMPSLLFGCMTSNRDVNPADPDSLVPPQVEMKPPGLMTLSSTAIKEGQPIPRPYTCDGVNISPPLEWNGTPKSAKTIVIIADDPDAPSGTWVHWVVYNLPAENIGLVENLPLTEGLKAGGFQGKNDFQKIGYGGPWPPSGNHRYFFKDHALATEVPFKAGATKADVEKA